MPVFVSNRSHDSFEPEVLTLGETAAFLRVPEEAVLALVSKDTLPGQQIGGEWRILKRAVVEWLRLGPHVPRQFEPFTPPRGSSDAVLRHFAAFRDDGDLDSQLAAARAAREGTGR